MNPSNKIWYFPVFSIDCSLASLIIDVFFLLLLHGKEGKLRINDVDKCLLKFSLLRSSSQEANEKTFANICGDNTKRREEDCYGCMLFPYV